ncbi:hypothetical protein ABPG72_014424 [Tetrahymena utriculariae]
MYINTESSSTAFDISKVTRQPPTAQRASEEVHPLVLTNEVSQMKSLNYDFCEYMLCVSVQMQSDYQLHKILVQKLRDAKINPFRYQKYTEEDKQEIIKISENNRNLTAAQISKDDALNPKGISARTIQRILNAQGLKSRRKQVMQHITEKNKEERLRIAQKYIKFNEEKMRKIFYSDESNICLSMNGIQLVRKYDYEKWNTEQFRKEQKTKPLSINIWMIISYEGVEHIKWTSSVPWINGEYYRNNILKRYIINDERLQKGSQFKGFFQQDRATSHTAKATQSYLKDNKVNVIEWPPKGADLSPIELCFSEIQRKMKSYFSEITTKQQLWDRVSEMVFEEEFNEYVKKCYDTISQFPIGIMQVLEFTEKVLQFKQIRQESNGITAQTSLMYFFTFLAKINLKLQLLGISSQFVSIKNNQPFFKKQLL